MLKVEYLVFIDNESIRCSNTTTFNHLLQSDPDISVTKNNLTHKSLTVDYAIKSGKVSNTDNSYFHLSFGCKSTAQIDEFSMLLRAIRSVLHLTNKTPQTLYDGVSLYYTQKAYPLVFDVENLMRKLITKFMLTNVGVDWIKERVPEDVRSSINSGNKDMTFLHNVDFIQLKNFLFSENFPTHKDSLVQKLKNAKSISELNIEEIKSVIPTSNWDKYFSEKVQTSKEQLSREWDELYDLRCRIAHNRAFTKSDFENVEKLCSNLQKVIQSAIENLDKIDITESESEMLTETIVTNFNLVSGQFLTHWSKMTNTVRTIVKNKLITKNPDDKSLGKIFKVDLNSLLKEKIIPAELFLRIQKVITIRGQITHGAEPKTHEEMTEILNEIKNITAELKQLE